MHWNHSNDLLTCLGPNAEVLNSLTRVELRINQYLKKTTPLEHYIRAFEAIHQLVLCDKFSSHHSGIIGLKLLTGWSRNRVMSCDWVLTT